MPEAGTAQSWLKFQEEFGPLATEIRSFFASQQFADLTVTCQGKEWKVHKFWVCAQSQFFKSSCSTQFKEGNSNTIALDDDDPRAVEAMMRYFYTFDYGDDGNAVCDTDAIVFNVRMFVIADKYLIEPLKKIAIEKFQLRCQSEWRTAAFANAAAEVYALPGATALRETVIETIIGDDTDLLKNSKQYPAFAKALRETVGLAADIMEQSVSDAPSTSYKCPVCHSEFSAGVQSGCKFTCPYNCQAPCTSEQWEEHRC